MTWCVQCKVKISSGSWGAKIKEVEGFGECWEHRGWIGMTLFLLCGFFLPIFVCILAQSKSKLLYMHLRRILSFGALVQTLHIKFHVGLHIISLGCIWRNRPLVWSFEQTLCLLPFKADTLHRPSPVSLASAVLNRAAPVSSLSPSLSLLSDLFACLSPYLRRSSESPGSRRLFLLMLIASMAPVTPLLCIVWTEHPSFWGHGVICHTSQVGTVASTDHWPATVGDILQSAGLPSGL